MIQHLAASAQPASWTCYPAAVPRFFLDDVEGAHYPLPSLAAWKEAVAATRGLSEALEHLAASGQEPVTIVSQWLRTGLSIEVDVTRAADGELELRASVFSLSRLPGKRRDLKPGGPFFYRGQGSVAEMFSAALSDWRFDEKEEVQEQRELALRPRPGSKTLATVQGALVSTSCQLAKELRQRETAIRFLEWSLSLAKALNPALLPTLPGLLERLRECPRDDAALWEEHGRAPNRAGYLFDEAFHGLVVCLFRPRVTLPARLAIIHRLLAILYVLWLNDCLGNLTRGRLGVHPEVGVLSRGVPGGWLDFVVAFRRFLASTSPPRRRG